MAAATSLHVAGVHPTLRRLPRRPSVSCKAFSVAGAGVVSAASTYWSGINADVEAYLDRSFPAVREPLVVHRSLRDLVLSAAPRTMAPALVVAAADFAGGAAATRSDAVAVAAAFHAFYAAAHAHEHLPGLIEKPAPAASTTPANIRLLCGADAVHPFVFGELARTLGSDPVRATRIVAEMARLMGSQGYVLGQYMHVKWARGEEIKEGGGGGFQDVCEKKEGQLFSGAAACGAILAGADEGDEQRLRRFGFYVGMIYGMLFGTGREESVDGRVVLEQVASFRTSALKELEGFRECDQTRKVDYISSLVDVVAEAA